MYKGYFDLPLGSRLVDFIKVIAKNKLVFKNKREMSLGLSNHLCSPNCYVAPIRMNDLLIPR